MNHRGNNSHSIKPILVQVRCLNHLDDQGPELITGEMRPLHWCCQRESSIREEAEQEDLVFWKRHDCAFLSLCTDTTVGTQYFYSCNSLDCFLWMFPRMEGIVKMRVLVAKSTLAAHLSELLPVSQHPWACLQGSTVCSIAYKQSIC